VTFILQHAGMLEDLSPAGIAAWRSGMTLLAARPNVVSKLSGLGTFLRRNDAAHVALIARETLALFGADRCLFGSNFPIEKLWTSYAELFAAHRAAVPEGDRAAVFSATAKRVYRLA
jgi:predicted TIM-barrel fold metal-dependent hydrolase